MGQMTAEQRATELLHTPGNQVPPLALGFYQFLASKYGACTECAVTAFAAYAQIVEGLPCTHQPYLVDALATAWFREESEKDVAVPIIVESR